MRMPCERPVVSACDRIPETDGLVPTATSDSASIGTKRYAIDRPPMPCERLVVSAGDRIPETDG